MLKTPKLKEQSFLVYGLGLTGSSVIKFFKKKKISNFKVYDDKNKNLFKSYRTKNLNKTLKQVDYIVLSPGISLYKNKNLQKYKKKIITDLDLFYLENKKFKSIVVTGTNGKSTTCKLLDHVLKRNKFKCLLGGNIGKPLLSLNKVNNSFVIIEASSFQLSHSKFICPDFAIFINFTNDHLDWHGSKNEYLNAKLKIFKNQNKRQYAFINKNLKMIFKKKNFQSRLIIPKIKNYKKIKFKIKNSYLASNINDENVTFVFELSKLMNISEKSFLKSIQSFKGLEHRFEIFMKKKNFTFINDSKATTCEAATSAISSLKNIFWILGGLPKKGDKINLLNYKENIIKCYIIGESVNFFKNQIEGKVSFSISKTLENAIIQITKDYKFYKKKKCSILLSPAAASFDQFKNFEIRGTQFKKLSKKYARKFI
jgi:UDP-N-acetylmuramoylalanine--D-glutamate ligase|tara:strand:+ start:8816 stop:10093 length:1278 start_codon:yes stop_codon:yes gene_type:complete